MSRTTLTTHVWTAPPLRRGSPIHDKAFGALRYLNADLARFLPWYSHPRLAVPALTPPTTGETSWNFDLLDPFVEDFMNAAQGRPVVADFATIPAWMFVTPEPVPVAEDLDEIHWEYEQGTELRDPTLNEVVDYFYRIASWYIAGGFADELGRRHESGHHYRFAYWEVLCEPDMGHRIAPETRTFINEVGSYPPDLMNPAPTIPEEYWSLSAAMQSYLWARLVELGGDLVGIAEFMDYPDMIPGTTLVDWDTGAPNARYRALQLLLRHFAPGDSLVTTTSSVFGYPDNRIHAQGFVTVDGGRKLLLVNKTAEPVTRPGEPVVIDAFATAVVSF